MIDDDREILVPASLLAEAIQSLRIGGDAVLDRDWACYPPTDKTDAETFVGWHFNRLVSELERLLAQDV